MIKKIVIGGLIVMIVAVGMISFASINNDIPGWFTDMQVWREEKLEEQLENGLVTEEEANILREEWAEMDAYRIERGFTSFGFGNCHRRGFRQ